MCVQVRIQTYCTGLLKKDCQGRTQHTPVATPCDFFLWGYVKDQVYVPPVSCKYPGTEGTNQNRH